MGGGDLNLKKSWTVHSMKNQSRVWDAEQSELAERKKIEQVRRERQEEAQMEEIARMAEEAGGTKRQQRVEWMYSGAAAVGTGTGTSEEQEAFLLGKRRVILKKKAEETILEQKPLVQQDPIKDITSKVALDPLLMIQKQEQEALERISALQAKVEESKRRKEERESRRRYHSDRQLSSRYREDRSKSPRRSRPDQYESSRRRDDRSRSPKRHYSSRHRSRSPHRKHSSKRDRSRSPRRDQSHKRNDRSRSPNRSSRDYRDRREPSRYEKPRDEDREAKLAAMQSDASNLESDRARRLEEMDKKEAEERQRDEIQRNKGKNFKAGIYQQTENVGLASRLSGARNSTAV